MINLYTDLDKLNDIYINDYPQYYNDRVNQGIPTVDLIQLSTGQKNENIFQYHIGDGDLYTLFINEDVVKLNRQSIPEDFQVLLANYRESLSTYSNSFKKEYPKLGIKLYEFLIKPFEAYIKKESILVIIPDGPLNDIPFDALLTNF